MLVLFYAMAYFYVIYRYVFSEWRSSRPVEITHYNITMGNDIARDAHRGGGIFSLGQLVKGFVLDI